MQFRFHEGTSSLQQVIVPLQVRAVSFGEEGNRELSLLRCLVPVGASLPGNGAPAASSQVCV